MKKIILSSLLFFTGLSFQSAVLAAPATLDGMNMIKQWTDFEDQAGEMPGFIWGTSDTDGADRIGLHVEFANGLSGSITYSGVSGLWNTSNFTGPAADTITGFFSSAGNLHFLFNTNVTTTYPDALPIAWNGFVMDFSGNFDLDYNEFLGSNFRASVAGWESVTIATYSSTAAPVPEPSTIALFSLGMLGMFAFSRRKRKV